MFFDFKVNDMFGEPLTPLTIHRVAFSPDGEILATGNWALLGWKSRALLSYGM